MRTGAATVNIVPSSALQILEKTGAASTLGRFEILTELGRGAMGIVYKAFDPKINRFVTLKTISLAAPNPTEEQADRDRFFREAEAAGRLSHPRIVAIYDIGEDPDTLSPYIVMEHVAGRSLEEILDTKSGSIPLDTSLQVIQEIAEALDYAHLQGVVHRDVKPSNIIIGDDGHARIADFGIAQLRFADSSKPGRTCGTPAYMSPEQLRGESVDGRSDLFSLGVILYRMLTGHRPFQGNSAKTVSLKVASQNPMPVTLFDTALPPDLDRVVQRAIAKNPANRYQTGMEMILDLQQLRNGMELKYRSDPVQLRESNATGLASLLRNLFFSPEARFQSSDDRKASVRYSRPWQQLTIALSTLGLLSLAFLGLWRVIPINAKPRTTGTATVPRPDRLSVVNIMGHDPSVQESPQGAESERAISPNHTYANRLFAQESRCCHMGIVVEHHFLMADLSVWIDGRPIYSHPLRGATKTRVVLFKGVEGYLSDVLQLTPGNHNIRVGVLSADGAYDESGVISGTFAAGSEQMLAIGFDKHNRRMRLAFEAKPLMQQSVSPTGPALKR